MDTRSMSGRPAPEPATITAASLEAAYRKVRASYGPDAAILGTRSVTRPRRDGLGLERLVEVSVARSATTGPDPLAIVSRLEAEVTRLERRVTELLADRESAEGPTEPDADPLLEAMIRLGCSSVTARRLVTRFRSESPEPGADMRSWLAGHVGCAGGTWDDLAGLHAFVGPPGSGRTRLILGAAARVAATGRRVLVLSVAPAHRGEIRRLQAAASSGEFDAAVIQKPKQIVDLSAHVGEYGAVFIDLPALDDPALLRGGDLHAWLAGHHGLHRHLAVPLDLDFTDADHLPEAARTMNCDWLAVTRTDRTRRSGKVLDLLEEIPLPLSLLAGTEEAVVAEAGALAPFWSALPVTADLTAGRGAR